MGVIFEAITLGIIDASKHKVNVIIEITKYISHSIEMGTLEIK